MARLSQSIPLAKQRYLRLQASYEKFEYADDENLRISVKRELDDLSREILLLEDNLQHEGGARKSEWREAIKQLSANRDSLSLAFTALVKKRDKSKRTDENVRGELFDGVAQVSSMLRGESLVREDESLKRSTAMIDDYTGQSQLALRSLRNQRETLQNSHRKAHETREKLGLSNSIIRFIERKERINGWLVFGGMIVSLLFLFTFAWYIRSPARPIEVSQASILPMADEANSL